LRDREREIAVTFRHGPACHASKKRRAAGNKVKKRNISFRIIDISFQYSRLRPGGGRFSKDLRMNDLSTLESEVATMIVDALNLEDVDPAGIEPDQPLFNAGLGLDSIDALELALAISNRYGFQLKSDDADNARIFASLRSLAETIEKRRTK